tara:strand:+ start:529 stop:915 length:387 start_codon:yes stop_codon:yes gene_type:complete
MEPDYSKYSKAGLEEALSSIDKERYPKRLEIILCELQKRKELEPDTHKVNQGDEFGLGKQIFVCIGAATIFVYGIYALIHGAIQYKGSVYKRETDPLFFYLFVGFVLGTGVYCFNYVIRYRIKRAKSI